MQFCLKYKRKNEFKRLAEMLRQHLDAANYQQSKSGSNIVDLSDDSTLQRYLEQRFHLVNVCVKLELWHEAFKSIEDVYHLSKMSKSSPKPSTLASYYENLAKVFFVSGNQALHNAAWEKFYKLYITNKNASEENLERYASIILLSALAIQPDYLPTVGYDPQARLNRLLGFETKPTKEESLKAALDDAVFTKVDADVKDLYNVLELNYNPETIKDDLAKLLPRLESKPYFSQYVGLLRDITVRKVYVSASQNHSVINVNDLYEMASLPAPMDMGYWDMEKALLQAAVDDYVSFTIDHESNTINFVKDPFEVFTSIEISTEEEGQLEDKESEDAEGGSEDEEAGDHEEDEERANDSDEAEPEPVITRNTYIRNKLSELSKELNEDGSFKDTSYLQKIKLARESLIRKTHEIIENTKRMAEERAKKSQEQKQKYLASAAANAEQDAELRQQRIMEERAIIEAKMEEEAQRRMVEKKKRELNALKEMEVKKFIEEVNAKGQVYIDPKDAKDLEIKDVRKLIVGQLSKDQLEINERMEFALKRLDHTERALRKFELPLLQKQAAALENADFGEFEKMKTKIISNAKEEHQARLADHELLAKAFDDYKKLKNKVIAKNEEEVAKLRAEKQVQFDAAKKARIDDVRKQRYEELVAQRKEEIAAKEREEREQKQAEFQRNQDEIARKQREMQEAAAEKQASFAKKQDDIARRQREIEAAGLQKQGNAAPASTPSASIPSARPFATPRSKEDLDRIALKQREMEEAAEKKQAGGSSNSSSTDSPSADSSAAKTMSYAEKMRLKRMNQRK